MDKGADTDIVYAGASKVFDIIQVDTAAGFRFEAAADERQGFE